MEEKGANPCPFPNCKENEIRAFHFGFNPLRDVKNFLPGHLKGKKRMNDKSDEINCAYCALSMFKTEDGARKKWWKELQPIHRHLLKYTHLLEGNLKRDLGVMNLDGDDHFTFFEYEGVDLRDHFKVQNVL